MTTQPTYTKEETKEHRKLWTDALRSGDYEQGDSQLRIDPLPMDGPTGKPQFCCLGVACEVAKKVGAIDDYDGEDNMLPNEVQQWLGLDSAGGHLIEPVRGHNRHELATYDSLWELNDQAGLGFSELADIIDDDGVHLR